MEEHTHQHHIAVVLAAGSGNRMCSDVPKQYMDLCGMPVVAWSLKAFQEFEPVDAVILVAAQEDIEYCRYEIIERYRYDKVRRIVPGGTERYLSVWEGLKAAKGVVGGWTDEDPAGVGFLPNAEESLVFIHDGARPMIDRAILERAFACAKESHACVVGMPVKDTIKTADEEGYAVQTPERRLLWQIQTPQVFSLPLVYDAYRSLIGKGDSDVTDDAMVVERESNARIRLVEGSYRNLKITTPEDLAVARYMMGALMGS